jgi:D-arabinose 1-dehydrogenase-like Zn-dependent alcohol dehydrogenase
VFAAHDKVAVVARVTGEHTEIQFASKMGFKTIAISRGKDKEDLVRKLGATQYIDSKSQNTVEELVKLGSAKIILGTASSGKALSSVLGGLAVNGELIIIGASDCNWMLVGGLSVPIDNVKVDSTFQAHEDTTNQIHQAGIKGRGQASE